MPTFNNSNNNNTNEDVHRAVMTIGIAKIDNTKVAEQDIFFYPINLYGTAFEDLEATLRVLYGSAKKLIIIDNGYIFDRADAIGYTNTWNFILLESFDHYYLSYVDHSSTGVATAKESISTFVNRRWTSDSNDDFHH